MMELLLIVIAIALAALAAIVLGSLSFARYVMRLEAPEPRPQDRWLQHADMLEEVGRRAELDDRPSTAKDYYAAAAAARRQAARHAFEEEEAQEAQAARHGGKHA